MPLYYVGVSPYSDFLMHHGIIGQKWGIRRFQNPDGSLTAEGRERYGRLYGISDHVPNAFEKNLGFDMIRLKRDAKRLYKIADKKKQKGNEKRSRFYTMRADSTYIKSRLAQQMLWDYSTLSDHEKEIAHGKKWLQENMPFFITGSDEMDYNKGISKLASDLDEMYKEKRNA